MIQSRKVEPRWLVRWSRQAWELVWRAPVFFFVFCLGITIFSMFIPQRDGLTWVEAGFIVSLWFLLARASDWGAGPDVASLLAGFWRETRGDIFRFCRTLLLFGIAIHVVLFLMSFGIDKLVKPFVSPAAHQKAIHHLPMSPFWVGAFNRFAEVFLLGLLQPISGLLVFLTLSHGEQMGIHLHESFQAMLKNVLPSTFLIAVFFSIPIALSIATHTLQSSKSSFLVLYGFALFEGFMAFWVYCFSREVFEGRGENQKVANAEERRQKIVGA